MWAKGVRGQEEGEGLGGGWSPGFMGEDASCRSALICCVALYKLLHFSELWFPLVMTYRLVLRIK